MDPRPRAARRHAHLLGVVAALAVAGACHGGGGGPPSDPSCPAAEVPADGATRAPRPPEADATFSFPGDMPEQREFVVVHEDGSYDYMERWEVGSLLEPELRRRIGWDWKVGCRMHLCAMPDGTTCCHQTCRDGGASGAAYEPPDVFGCMNAAAGGRFEWFVRGLHRGGMEALAACGLPPGP